MSQHGSWRIVLAIVVLAVVVGGCKEEEKKPPPPSPSSRFWPEAPTPRPIGGPREIRYNPDNIKGYAISVDVRTKPGSAVEVTAKMNIEIGFDVGAAPRSRDVRIRKLDLDVEGPGRIMKMLLDKDGFSVIDGSGPPKSGKRGDQGPVDVAAMVDNTFTTLTFTEDNQVRLASNAAHPFVALGGDVLDTALIMFPDLPNQVVTPGHKWTIERNVPLGQGIARVDVTYHLEYVGESACPSGAGTCAQILLTAATNEREIEQKGMTMTVAYRFLGKAFVDLDKGSIDESRVRMDMDVKVRGERIAMAGVYRIKPT
jgi:hypothetical protein